MFFRHDGYDGGYCRPSGGQDTSLPDFLSDGPIRSERRDSDSPPPSPQTPADLRHSPRVSFSLAVCYRSANTKCVVPERRCN